MKITIITVSLNNEQTIGEALQSVQDQDFESIEHIVVDGQSSDKTLRIIKSFSHLSTILSEKDTGIYDAMNKGISLATGDVVGILNADDKYVHGKVISLIAEVFSDQSIDACYGDLQYVDQNLPEKVVRIWRSGDYYPKSFYWGWMPPHPTFFVRRRVYQQVGNFNTRLRSAADYEMMLRILVKNQLTAKYIPEVLVKMRAGGASNASFKHRIKANKEDRLAWKLNELRPYFFTLYLKPIRKIPQFLIW